MVFLGYNDLSRRGRSETIAKFRGSAGCFWDAQKVVCGFCFRFFFCPTPAQGTEILQSAIPPEQAVDRTFSDLSTLGGCQKEEGEDFCLLLTSTVYSVAQSAR